MDSEAVERRQFLTTIGVTTAIAGCSSQSGSESTATNTRTLTATSTPTATATETETPTETPVDAPAIARVNPISGWDEMGDVAENAVAGFGRGSAVAVGAELELPARDGALDVSYRLEISKGGELIDEQIQNPSRTTVDATATMTEEVYLFSASSASWELGEYDASFVFGDDITGQIVEDDSLTFTLNEPLTGDECRLVSAAVPDGITTEEPFDYSLTLANESDRDSSLATDLSVRREGNDEWNKTGGVIKVNIGSGRSRQITLTDTTIGQEGTYIVRLDSIGDTFKIEVQSG